jgi:hypothetical protein
MKPDAFYLPIRREKTRRHDRTVAGHALRRPALALNWPG